MSFNYLYKKFEKNKSGASSVAYLILLQILSYGLPLITFPYLIRVLGVETFGMLVFSVSVTAYFKLITDYGFNLTATRKISTNRNKPNKVNEIFSSVITIKLVLLVVSFILLYLLIQNFKVFNQYKLVLYLTFGDVIGQVLFPIWVFQGLEKMKYITLFSVIPRFIFTGAIFYFVQTNEDFYIVPLLNSIASIFTGLISLYYVFYILKIKFIPQKLNSIKFYLKEAWAVFTTNIFVGIYTTSNIIILGIFTNNTIVGYYSIVEKILNIFKRFYGAFIQGLYPNISLRVKNNSKIAYYAVIKILTITGVVMLTISFLLFFSSDFIINIIAGSGYEVSISLLRIMSFMPFIVSISNIITILWLYNIGQFRTVNNFIIILSLFHLLISTIGVKFFDVYGLSISVVITELSYTIFTIIKFKKTIHENYIN
jgi:PST family polysaccharide transporter